MTVEELFGTLQESITTEWRKHLQTGKYSKHMALDEFYKDMPEKVDALIEAYQADNDIVKDYKNILDDSLDALEYMQELKKTVKEGRKLFEGESELESLTDDILGLIDSTIYKLKHLKESMISLRDFIVEALDESVMDTNLDVTDANVNPLVAPFNSAGKWGECSSWKGASADLPQDAFDRLWAACDPKLLKKLGCTKQAVSGSKSYHEQMRIMWYDNGGGHQLYINFGAYMIEWPNGLKSATGGKWSNCLQVYPKYIMLGSTMTSPGTYMAGGKRNVWIIPDNIAEMIFDTLGLKYSKR